MATPNQIMPRLEGLIGSGLRANRAPQRVILWKDIMRTIMFSQSLRDATDWTLAADIDVVEAASSVDASGGTVYGVLLDSIYDVAGEPGIFMMSNITHTLTATSIDAGADATGMGDGTATVSRWGFIGKFPDATGTTDARFATFVFPDGMVFDAGIFISFDGEESTAPTANDVRAYILYRDTAEAQV